METTVKTKMTTKSLVITAMLIALSLVGANFKVFGSVAFDSLPGFVAALLLGPAYGAAIGFLGHMFTAMTSGFPLSLPLHLVIGLAMALTMTGFGLTYGALEHKVSQAVRLIITGIAGIILNGPSSLAFTMGALTLMAGKEAALGLLAMLPALVLASAANVVLSLALFKPLMKIWVKMR